MRVWKAGLSTTQPKSWRPVPISTKYNAELAFVRSVLANNHGRLSGSRAAGGVILAFRQYESGNTDCLKMSGRNAPRETEQSRGEVDFKLPQID